MNTVTCRTNCFEFRRIERGTIGEHFNAALSQQLRVDDGRDQAEKGVGVEWHIRRGRSIRKSGLEQYKKYQYGNNQ